MSKWNFIMLSGLMWIFYFCYYQVQPNLKETEEVRKMGWKKL